ncbi:MAG TPA: cytochrome c biogenesis protein CcsA [Candidatus Acidoferrum sp.]|nr:cytochrome c biogenesis protein CcsA [Candidatus Acidoferrum sp.]
MYASVLNLAVVGYVCATGLALAYLIQREEFVHRLASLATAAAWALHTLGLIALAIQTGRPPIGTVPDSVSTAVWVVVLVQLWIERRYQVKVLGAFVLPIVVVLSLKTIIRSAGLAQIGPTLGSAWIWVHITLATVGIAAFVLNFAGAVMYLLQEHQLRTKRLGAFYYRLPALETLDRLTYRTLALGFPFLTVGLILGALWAGTAWGSLFAFDPLALFSFVAWTIYAATLAGRAAAGWHGRRAAYFAVVGFAALVVTLGAGLFLPGRHGS